MDTLPTLGILPLIAAIVYYATYPLTFLYRLTTSLLSLLLTPILSLTRFLLLPLTYTLVGIYHVLAFPFRLRLLERLETLWIYFGIAGIIGVVAGGVLYVVYSTVVNGLGIDRGSERERARFREGQRRRERERKEKMRLEGSGRTADESRTGRRFELEGLRRRSALDYPEFATAHSASGTGTPAVKRESGVREGELKEFPLFEEEDSW